uniref:ATP synthase F0 subunit 8 n=1 Tax=Phyllonorycter ringoniella TaxID=571297 RepID=UPI001FA71E5D|nr:ATP synthase F0 subunit 8 [Phyllonorycter ringoniella]ULF47730.1 ATP synthase F0 subunit 8 [Phyllonorycter ringoniella]
MPQMMPINWILLFFFFNCIYLLFLIMNYYNYNINPIKNNMKIKNFKSSNIQWKW